MSELNFTSYFNHIKMFHIEILTEIFPVAQMVKNLPAMQETQVRPLGQEDALEEGMAIHSSILASRIPWTEEPGRLQSMVSQELDMTLKWSPSKKKQTPRPYGEKLTSQESEESAIVTSMRR